MCSVNKNTPEGISGIEFTATDKNDNVIERIALADFQLENSTLEDDGNEVFFQFGDFKVTLHNLENANLPIEFLTERQIMYKMEDIAGECGGDVYYGYSGRAMYGACCYGITTDDPDACIAEATRLGFGGHRKDSMGRGTIVYWPNLICSKPRED